MMTNTTVNPPATLEVLLREAQWLRRLAVHLVQDPDDAADIVQETWIAAWRAKPDTGRPVKGWLGTVALNLARRRARSRGRRDRHETAAATAPEAAAQADAVLERMQLQRTVAERVMALEEPLRATVCLHYYDGMTSAQVGEALGVPEGTVRWRLKEAREQLRRELDRRCNGRQAWAVVLAPSAWAKLAPSAKVGTSAKVLGVALVVALVVGVVVRARRPTLESAHRYAWTAPVGAKLRIFGAPAPAPAGALSGAVKLANGRAAPGVVVTARRRGGEGRAATVVSSAAGTFAFQELADGEYQLTAASAEALSSSVGPVAIRSGGSVRDVILTLGSGGFVLSGRLLDGGGGAIPGATLQARAGEASYTARADEQGHYALRLAPAQYRVEADADGYAARTGDVNLVGDLVRDFRLDPAGRMGGLVLDGASGKPVAGAVVRAQTDERPPTVAHTTSDEQGRFAFGDLAPGEYAVSARAGARVGFRSGHVVVPVAGEIDAGPVLLEPAFEISGRVVDANGKPVAGASVLVDEDPFDRGAYGGVSMARSDAEGRYRIEGVAPGRMRVRAGGVLPWAPSVSALVTVKDASLRQDFTLPVGGKIAGRLVGPDGTAVSGAMVFVEVRDSDAMDAPFRGNGHVATDADGRFAIGGLGPGRVDLQVFDKRWGQLNDRRLTLTAGQTLEATFTFPAPASIAGAVSWDSGGVAAGVRVRWIPFGRHGRDPEAITDKAGHFTLAPCSPGPGVAQAELPTQYRMNGGLDGPNKKRLTLTAAASVPDVQLVLARNDKAISGVVLDPSGRPLADASVAVDVDNGQGPGVHHLSEQSTRTDPDGRFRLEHLTAGRYVLWAAHSDYPEVDLPGTEAGATGVRVRFSAGATIAGTVKDQHGAPVRLYTLVLVSPEGPGHTNGFGSGFLVGREEKVNDAGGAFTVGRVAPGSYDLLVTAADGRVARTAGVTVGAGERRELALVLRPAVTLRGRVLDGETGAPLAGARVVVMGTREHVHATSDDTGAFTLVGQIPGRTLLIQVVFLGGHIPSAREIAVPDRELVDLRPFRLLPEARFLASSADPVGPGDVGLRLSDREDGMLIEQVVPGSPAAQAGLKVGDRVLAVGGRDVGAMGPLAAGFLLRGAIGSRAEITVSGTSGPRTITLERTADKPVVASGR